MDSFSLFLCKPPKIELIALIIDEFVVCFSTEPIVNINRLLPEYKLHETK